MSTAPRIGILGGTLDPIHVGHLDTAIAARAALVLDRVLVLPSRVPPHRSTRPTASPFHRFAMAALAVNGVDGLVADDLELRSADGPSYTAETLERLRCGSGLTSTQIFFITGADAFAEIETWHRYPEVLDLAHFVVVSRPGCPVAGLPARVPALAPRMIADTARLERERTPSVFLLDARTRDVSSTEIRRRIAGNESIDGMVPAAVAAHILQHGLYRPAAHSTSADHLHGED